MEELPTGQAIVSTLSQSSHRPDPVIVTATVFRQTMSGGTIERKSSQLFKWLDIPMHGAAARFDSLLSGLCNSQSPVIRTGSRLTD
jgi:hypothetical protein